MPRTRAISATAIVAISIVAAACANDDPTVRPAAIDAAPARVVVPSRLGAMEHHPCAECHVSIESAVARIPEKGPHRNMVFDHMENVADCYQCHDPSGPGDQRLNQLRLLSGKSISFDETPTVCGQCHSSQKADWDLGIHGKQVGSWRNVRQRFSCTDCHDAHSPKRPTMLALPPPPFPKLGIRKVDHE